MPFVIDFLEGKNGSLLVEGCGSGRHSSLASELGFKVIGFDFSLEMIKLAREADPEGFYLVADARALPFKDEVFNHSVSIAVLHHLKPEDCLEALKELRRVTANKSLISVWKHDELRGKAMIPWGSEMRFYYLYETEEFEKLVGRVFTSIELIPDEQNIVLSVL